MNSSYYSDNRVQGSSYRGHQVHFVKRMIEVPDPNKEEEVRDLFFATVRTSREDL
jgi:hypothetical protein